MIQLCRLFLHIFQHSFRMMQIVSALNFSYINKKRIAHLPGTKSSLVTRHMHGKIVRIRIISQCFY